MTVGNKNIPAMVDGKLPVVEVMPSSAEEVGSGVDQVLHLVHLLLAGQRQFLAAETHNMPKQMVNLTCSVDFGFMAKIDAIRQAAEGKGS